MTEQQVFLLADEALNEVVQQISDEQWEMTMSEDFQTSEKKPVTLKEVINYHAYEDAWVPDMLAGKTMDEVGKEAYKGDLLKNDPKGNFKHYVDIASEAVRSFPDADMDKPVHVSFGDFPAREYFWQLNFFRGLRAHDIAKELGIDVELSDELVKGLWDGIEPRAEEWRGYGVFGPEVKVAEDAPLLDKLLGLTGRQP